MEVAKGSTPLGDMFPISSPSPEAETASPVTAEPVSTEAAVEVKPEATAEVKVEATAETKPDAAAKVEPPVTAEAKAEEKTAEVKEAKVDAPKSDWDSPENPYKKRYEDTRDYSTRVNQENAEFKKELAKINAKLDGTYDPSVHETPAKTQEQEKTEAEILGRVSASEEAAYRIYGEGDSEKGKPIVTARLKEFNDKFGQHKMVQYRVMNSRTPIIEAMKVMEEAELIGKYGNEPKQIIAAIRKEAETELEAKITERVTKQLMGRLENRDKVAPTLINARGAGKDNGAVPTGPTPLKEMFPL